MKHSDTGTQAAWASLHAFAAFLDRLQAPLFVFVRGIMGDDEDARDVMQDCFCSAWEVAQRGSAPFDANSDEPGIRRWFFHVAYNRAVSNLRHRRVIRWESLADSAIQSASAALALPSFEDRIVEDQALQAALAALPPTDVACLLLIIIHGFTAAETGQIMGMSSPAVAKRFARAKQRLRDVYLAQNEQPPTRSTP